MNMRDNRPEKKRRADMYWPWWVPVLSVVFIGLGIALTVNTYGDTGTLDYVSILILCGFLLMGGYLLLSWKNETIHMLPEEDAFVCTTAFGRKTTYHFSDIEDFRLGAGRNSGSITLIMTDRKKVHIDSSMVLSDRFTWRLNRELAKQPNGSLLDKR